MELHWDPNRQEEMLQIKSTEYLKNNQMHVNTDKLEIPKSNFKCLSEVA